jgi:spermidine synthase
MSTFRRGIPIIYYVLTILTGLGAVISLLDILRQFSLFFGTHTVSTSTFMVSGFLCLALGSYIAGKLAGRALRPMIIFIAFSVLLGVFNLLQPMFYEWITELFFKINRTRNPGPFGVEMFRLMLTFAILLLPMSMLAGSFPLLTRHFIKHVGHSGRFMSAAIFSGSTGIMAGLLITLLLIIPQYGFRAIHFIVALINLLTAALAFYFLYRSRSKTYKVSIPAKSEKAKRTSMRFKKKKNVLETGVKLTRAMLRVYAFQGFTLTSMLILGFRILSNCSYFKPFYFHSIVLTIILTGLATGSALYKKISEKPVNHYMTLATLQIISGFVAILSYTVMSILTVTISQQLPDAKTLTGILSKQSFLFSSLLLIPAVLNGLSLPLAGKLYPKRLQQIGSIFGNLGSIFFLSAIAGLVITVFVLIPLMGLQFAYFLLALLTVLSGIYLIFRDSRLIRGFRLGYSFSVVILFIIMVSAFHIFSLKRKGLAIDTKIEGNTASISTTANPDGTRSVFLNGKYLFGSDQNSLKIQQLPAYLPLLINPKIQSALVIGFGSGLTASSLEKHDVSAIHITDILPEVIRLSSDVFADENNDIMTNSHVDITIEDARSYLIRSTEKIDLITSGIDLLKQMPNLHTTGFYQICFNCLTDQGLLCQILPTRNITGPEFRALLKSCAIVFPNISLWYVTRESILMVASKKHNRLELCDLSSAFSTLNADQSFTAIKIPSVESLLAHVIMGDKQVRSFIGDAPENSDNHPFVGFNPYADRKKGLNMLPLLLNTPADYSQLIVLQGNCVADTSEVKNQIKRFNQSLLQQDGFSSALQR